MNTNNAIINFYDCKKVKEKAIQYHNPSFQCSQIKHPSMIAVIGSTGSGKTQWLLNFLFRMQDTFTKVVIVLCCVTINCLLDTELRKTAPYGLASTPSGLHK